MRRFVHSLGLAVVLGTAVGAVAFEGTAVAQPAPAQPAAPSPPAAPAKPPAKKGEVKAALETPKEAAKPKDDAAEAKAARGVVVISRAGIPVGLGAVLGGDGRILTALSPIGSGNDLEVKFADNTTAKVKLGHHDRTWDLALLVPQSGKWTEGLIASGTDPTSEDSDVHTYQTGIGKPSPASTPVEITSKKALIGGDDQVLEDALELGSHINPMNLGSPLVDAQGKVVGIIGRGCLPQEGTKPCIPVAFGIPVKAIKSFLKTVPPDAVAPQPFLGIQGVRDQGTVARGVRVTSVAKNSPASAAKLKGGDKSESDTILAVGGTPVTTPDELLEAIRKHAIGEKVPFTIFSKEQYKTVDVVLGAPPVDSSAKLAKSDSKKEAAAPQQPATNRATKPAPEEDSQPDLFEKPM